MDEFRFRCEKCGRFASRWHAGGFEHRERSGLDVCPRCFDDDVGWAAEIETAPLDVPGFRSER